MYSIINKDNKPISILIVTLIFFLVFCQYSFAGEVTLSWSPNSESDLAGYKVYYDTSPASDNCPPANYPEVKNIDKSKITYTVLNLSEDTTYYFAVTAYDTSGNESCFSNEVSKHLTSSPSDTIPPALSGINAGNITSSSVTISWTTDEPADTQIEYGTTTSYDSNTSLISALITDHAQTITGLTPSTLYHYRVRSRDANNNLAFSGDYTFTTDTQGSPPPADDTASPLISEITVSSLRSTEAIITWTTNEPADSQIEYGTTDSYGYETNITSGLATSHNQTLIDLSPSTTYHYIVKSRDIANNLTISEDKTFTTLLASDTIQPVISDINVGDITGGTATISWITDDASTSQIEYGLTTDYGFSTMIDTAMVTNHSQVLTALIPANVYHYRTKSRDASGNTGVSMDNTFTTLQDSTPPSDIKDFTATPLDGEILLSWINPDDIDFAGVKIMFRTDRKYPVNETDGELAVDFTGQQGEMGAYAHEGLTNGVTYYYSAFSYDTSGNYTSTVFTFASPQSDEPSNSGGDESGDSKKKRGLFGCGSIKNYYGGSGPDNGQIAMNLVVLILPWMLVKIWLFIKGRKIYILN